MKPSIVILTILSMLMDSCQDTSDSQESNFVSSSIRIEASPVKVWDIITNETYAKELGNVFDKNAFVQSDWKLGSDVHFVYEPDKIVSTGTIGKLIENELIQVDYDFDGFEYLERYSIETDGPISILSIHAGPYTSDFEAQKEVGNNWLAKVKELSEN